MGTITEMVVTHQRARRKRCTICLWDISAYNAINSQNGRRQFGGYAIHTYRTFSFNSDCWWRCTTETNCASFFRREFSPEKRSNVLHLFSSCSTVSQTIWNISKCESRIVCHSPRRGLLTCSRSARRELSLVSSWADRDIDERWLVHDSHNDGLRDWQRERKGEREREKREREREREREGRKRKIDR